MEPPKPKPPVKKLEIETKVSKPSPKKPYVRRDHLTQRPFVGLDRKLQNRA